MSVLETGVRVIDRPGLFAVTVDAEIRVFGQPVFSPVSRVSYSASFRLFHMYQPHQSFLAVIIITAVTPVGITAIVSGLKNHFLNTLLHAEAMVKDSMKISMLPISIKSCLNI